MQEKIIRSFLIHSRKKGDKLAFTGDPLHIDDFIDKKDVEINMIDEVCERRGKELFEYTSGMIKKLLILCAVIFALFLGAVVFSIIVLNQKPSIYEGPLGDYLKENYILLPKSEGTASSGRIDSDKPLALQIPAEVIEPGDQKFIINDEIRYHLWIKGELPESAKGYVHIFAAVSGGEKYWVTGKIFSVSELQKLGKKIRVDWITLGSPKRSYTVFQLMAVLLPEKLTSGANIEQIPKQAQVLSESVTVIFNGPK